MTAANLTLVRRPARHQGARILAGVVPAPPQRDAPTITVEASRSAVSSTTQGGSARVLSGGHVPCGQPSGVGGPKMSTTPFPFARRLSQAVFSPPS